MWAARAGSRAGWKVAKKQYCTGEMAGSHLVMYTYDDLTSEIPLDKVVEHLAEQEQSMCEALLETCPAVFTADTPRSRMVDSRVLSHLSKGAKASRSADGAMQVTAVHMPSSLEKKNK